MGRGMWMLALACACVAVSHAQFLRTLPSGGKLGDLVGQQPFPLLQINNKVVRLAPGGLIYDRDNRTIVHASLPARTQILFVEDMNGDVARIYILRPEELEQLQRAR